MQKDFSQFRARYIVLDIILIPIITGILLGVISTIIGIESGASIFNNQILLYSLYSVVMLTICTSIFYKLKRNGIQIKYLIGDTAIHQLPWLKLLIIFYGIQSLSHGISQLTIFLMHLVSPDLTIFILESSKMPDAYSAGSLSSKILLSIVIFISIVLVAPLAEEFIFRGVVLHRLAAKIGVLPAVVFSALLFGAAHLNIYAISIGISFIFVTLLYLKTRALVVPILYHMMNNAMSMISEVVDALSYSNSPELEITLHTLWSGLLNTAFALPILLYFFKKPTRSELLPYTANIESMNGR
jgi:uncharacterized protein